MVGKTTKQIERGTFIDYRLRIHGIPMKWRSHIAEWEENKHFVDTQVKGPYGLWHHTHSFYSLGRGTLVVDRIRYRVPGGVLGNCLAGWFVKRDLEKIFGFRKSTIESLFKEIV